MLNVSGKPCRMGCRGYLRLPACAAAWALLRRLPVDPPPVGWSAGHLLSTAQVESALVEHEAVAEAAVVGRPHPIKGESLYCFVTLTQGLTYSRALEAELKKQGGWKPPSARFSEAFC